MATYVLIHGAGSDSWYWHRLARELTGREHDVVAPDLPCEDESAGFADYAGVVLEAIGDKRGLVVVAQSLGGFTAPLVCERVPVDMLVMLNAMIPKPRESAGEWWESTGWPSRPLQTEDDIREAFMNDFPPDLTAEAMKHGRDQAGRPFEDPWPLARWPDVETRVLIGRDDRFFPPDFQRRVTQERLGVTPDEIEGGHLVALSRPKDLAERLGAYARHR